MSIKTFTSEQINKLQAHPAVANINEYFLSFTNEFKEWFYQETLAGKQTKWILHDAGFAENTIPKSRYRSIRAHILQWKEKQPKQQFNGNDRSFSRSASAYELAAAKAKIIKLGQELKRTTQELEFIKKYICWSGGMTDMLVKTPSNIKFQIIQDTLKGG